MKNQIRRFVVCAAAMSAVAFGQNIAGTWQGSLQPPGANRALRLVVKMTRADDESLKAVMYSIDQGGQALNANTATQQGSTVKIVFGAIGGNFEGKMAADGNTIAGTWTQGPAPMPLTLTRATAETAWAIPEPPPPPKLMPADAMPEFEVATIKPSPPDSQGTSILVGRGGQNQFTTTNTTLKDIITFAYGLHARQIMGGAAWVDSDRYDLSAKPDQAGLPSVNQLKNMVQKLLADRFQLTFHMEKKELSAYAITTAKTGPKISKTQATGNLPGFGGRGPGAVAVRNATMAEFADFLQSRVVDRPVVDQSGLTDRYDFQLRWTPDGPPPGAAGANAGAAAPPPADNADTPPDLFAAVQQQLGLKLESTKAPVDVMVIDKVQKPSEN